MIGNFAARARQPWRRAAAAATAVGLMITTIVAIGVFAPTEETMGNAQRILYVHVAVAWLGLLGFVLTAATGMAYLLRKELKWDHWSQSAAELGWLFSGLTLVTGSLWARAAWGTWWTWEPRLTTMLILWLVYSGILIVRGSLCDPHHRARVGALLAVVGLLDVPMIVMATRWFRGIHPVSPTMEPMMRIALLLTVVSLTLFFAALLRMRQRQLRMEQMLLAVSQRGPRRNQMPRYNLC